MIYIRSDPAADANQKLKTEMESLQKHVEKQDKVIQELQAKLAFLQKRIARPKVDDKATI